MIIISSLLLSAFFSGMEIAYVSSNRLNLEIEKNQSGLIPKLLSIITQNPSRFIATMLIGNNFVLVIYGIFMGQFILDNLAFIDLTSINELTIVLIQTLISTLVILITAEFIPKVLFQIYSNISMKIFAIPAYFFYAIFYPITSLVTIISNFILKSFFKVNPDDSGISFSKVELENYIENEIEKSDKNLDSEIEIFQNALELSDIKARDFYEKKISDDCYEFSSRLEIEYLNKTYNLNLPESESYDTLGGLIVFNKEEIPRIGDEILIDNYSIEILLATSSKIEKVVVKKIDQE